MFSIFVVLLGLSAVHGRNVPYYEGLQEQDDSQLAYNPARNGAAVPYQPYPCPGRQELINGVCQQVWNLRKDSFEDRNMINVPTNCPEGQEFINDVCRDVWRRR